MKSNFISLNRRILDWRWYKRPNTFRLFVHVLLKANFKDKEWENITIKRGSFVTSYSHLAKELGLTVQQIRTAIRHLTETKEVSISTHTKYSVISVNKYDSYQKTNQNNTQATHNQQTTNKQLTTTNNVNNANKEINTLTLGGVDESYAQAKRDDIWLEHLMMRYTLKKNKILLKMDNFANFLKDKDEKHVNLKRFKSGFSGWLRTDTQKQSNSRHNNLTM